MGIRTVATSAVIAAALVASSAAAPDALAGDDRIGAAAAVMLDDSDVPAGLGFTGTQEFRARMGTAVAPLLCRAGRAVRARRTDLAFSASIELAGLGDPRRVAQHVYVYAGTTAAGKAFRQVVRRAHQCVGTWQRGTRQHAGDPALQQSLTSGRAPVRASGQRGVWIAGDFGPPALRVAAARDTYSVALLVGRTVQWMNYHVLPGQPGVTLQRRKAINRLARVLAKRWLRGPGAEWQ